MRQILAALSVAVLMVPTWASAQEKTFWAVVAGVTDYHGGLISKPELQLDQAADDVAAALRTSAQSLGYQRIVIKILNGSAGADDEPTRDNFLRAVSRFARETGRDDTLAVYFTGHGADRYLYGSGSDGTEDTGEKTIKLVDLYERLELSNARSNLVFLDTCRVRTRSRVGGLPAVENLSSPKKRTASFFSSTPPDPSEVDGGKSYGVFTKRLIEGLTSNAADGYLQTTKRPQYMDGNTTDSELGDFLETKVVADVTKIPGSGNQVPHKFSTATLIVYRDAPAVSELPDTSVDPDPPKVERPVTGAGLKKDVSIYDSGLLKNGELRCGVRHQAGFVSTNANGIYSGFNVDMCRGMAAAALGDGSRVNFVPVTGKTAFTTIASGEVDLLTDASAWRTLRRDSMPDRQFVAYPADAYYDGPGFMVRKNLGVVRADELDGASVCLVPGTRTEQSVVDFFRERNMGLEPIPIDFHHFALSEFAANKCDVLVADTATLAAQRQDLKEPESAVILPELLYSQPFGPAVRVGEDSVSNLIKMTLYAMIKAEEIGITSANVADRKNEAFKKIARIGGYYEKLGFGPNWAYNVIRQVGNYQEVYDRNLAPLGLTRGQNALLRDGGLLASHFLIN